MSATNKKPEEITNKIIIWGICAAMFNPLLISPYWLLPDKFAKAVIFRIIVEIILIAYLFLILRDKKYFPRLDILPLATAVFWTAALLSVIFSAQPFTSIWGSATRGSGFFNFTHYVILFFILSGVAREKSQWQKIFNFAVIAAALTALFAILQRIFPALNASYMNSVYYRPAGTMGNPIMLTNYLAMTVFLAFAFWKQETIRRKKILYFIAGTVILIAIFISQTRGTFLGLAMSGFFLLIFYPSKNLKFTIKKRLLILLIIIAALISPFFIFKNNLDIIPERFLVFDNFNRLTSWRIAVKAIADKPIFGWGMENFAIPFDKYYPGGYTNSYGNLAETWWDRAHNVPLDIGATMGLVGLIAYFFIFAAIFQRLRKNPNPANGDNISISHIVGAIFITQFIQNLTAFDNVSTEVMFFTFLAYVYFLTYEKNDSANNKYYPRIDSKRLTKWKKIIFTGAAIIILVILTRTSLIPFWLNYTSNKSVILARQGLYNETMQFYRGITEKYRGKTYFEKELNEKFMKIASYFSPLLLEQTQNSEEYLKLNQETINILNRSAELEPHHTKHYYNIGLFYNNIAVINPAAGKEGLRYFTKSLELSPNREQALIESSKLQIILSDYDGAIAKLQKTAAINPELAEPYIWLGIAHLYKKNNEIADKYFLAAKKYGYNFNEMNAWELMSRAYASNQEWAKAIPYYLKILEKEPNNIENRALLAGSYQKIGNKEEARREAEILLKIAPQAKESIEQFLKSL